MTHTHTHIYISPLILSYAKSDDSGNDFIFRLCIYIYIYMLIIHVQIFTKCCNFRSKWVFPFPNLVTNKGKRILSPIVIRAFISFMQNNSQKLHNYETNIKSIYRIKRWVHAFPKGINTNTLS